MNETTSEACENQDDEKRGLNWGQRHFLYPLLTKGVTRSWTEHIREQHQNHTEY